MVFWGLFVARHHIRDVFVQRTEVMPNQRATIVGAHGHQSRAAAGKVQNLKRARIFNQPFDVISDDLLGRHSCENSLGLEVYSTERIRAILVGI